jgi:peptidoglycan/LPS O-acetylase OafA/YrhL
MLSHIDIRVYGLNPGVIAVVIFYILAGYVVSHLLRDIYLLPSSLRLHPRHCEEAKPTRQSLNALWAFYKDRFFRIFPLYTSVVLLTLLFLLLTSFANPAYAPLKLLYNLTVIPLNYYMYIDSAILTNPSWWLIPPAWSLGTELQAYLLLPFALMYKRVWFATVFLSFGIYMLANFSVIHPDYFGYRFIAGVFFIFLAGSALQRYEKADKLYIAVLWTAVSLFALFAYFTDSFSAAYTKETYAGLLIGIPLVLLLSKTKVTLPFNKALGNLSYAVFLTHFLSIWILEYIGIPSSKTFAYILQLSLLTFFISALLTILPTVITSKAPPPPQGA